MKPFTYSIFNRSIWKSSPTRQPEKTKMEMTLYLALIIISVVPYAISQSLGGVAGATEHHVKGTFKCTRTSQGTSSTTSSSEAAADADVTQITTLAQHDTTKSTERHDSTTKQSVKTAADADMTHITTLAQHDTTKSTERLDSTTEEGVKNQSMYWISNYTSTWSDAVDRCRQLFNNGHLVHIDNEEEYNEVKAIRDQANIGDAFVWIGIHDSEQEGEWKYEDGSPLTYDNWRDGEPNNYNNEEDCVEMGYGLYNDRDCMAILYFCCEYYLEDIIN
ncbi:uncharacterized protein [Apostichopus japonicus]|uniref:uncharacterized protein isoform X2 n=1 Tax=Stichopus japonicus TaxID=307972 RepID=UPI003AB44C5C